MVRRKTSKSCHSDQFTSSAVDLSQVFGTANELGGDRVHKRVHRGALRMVSLTRDSNGNYRARKRIPAQVKAEYGRLYDVTAEEKFYRKAEVKDVVAKREFNEWLAEIETRIANIRAQQNGEGISLTRLQARALAGQWYDWFVGRHPFIDDIEKWEHVRDDIHEVMRQEVGDKCWEKNDPDNLWREDESLRKTMRPLLSDAGETAQFLAVKRLALDNETHALFLDFLYEDLLQHSYVSKKSQTAISGPTNIAKDFRNSKASTRATRLCIYSTAGWLNASQAKAPLKAGNMCFGKWKKSLREGAPVQSRPMRLELGLREWFSQTDLLALFRKLGSMGATPCSVGQPTKT
jgi:hypothetical protein